MRVPALEYKCNEWDRCMSEDPHSVITSMAYFEVLADCMNAFFHNISIKSLLSIGCLMVFCIVIPNILFSKFRSTTINQNYYGNPMNPDMSNVQTSSPLKPLPSSEIISTNAQSNENAENNSAFFTPISSQTNPSNNMVANVSGSVRFNPNVSYSMYDYEGGDVVKRNCIGVLAKNNQDDDGDNDDDDDDDDDENLIANQRILVDD